jgi:prepilin-type processing-associated H-X9-DG protein
MYHNQILKNAQSEMRLSLGIGKLDNLFLGFTLGDFAVIYGSSKVQALLTKLCVKAQLPYQLGGLKTNVLFVDGSNSFRLYDISDIAQTWELDPKQVLERIFVSRAFTAYQLTSIILDKLQTAVTKFGTKVVIISNLSQLFLDKNIPKTEAKEIFTQLTNYLSTFAKENQVILIITHRPYRWSKRTKLFKQTLCKSANIVMSIKNSNQTPYFSLEKHPYLQLGKAEFPSNNCTLLDFVKG